MSIYHEVSEALAPLVQAFNQLGIVYYIGGSVSSSLHGVPRRTQDVDVIAAIALTQIPSLVQLLHTDYYLDESAWKDATRRGLPYNLIHLSTMMKVDLLPLKPRAFSQQEARRAQSQVLEAGAAPVRIASAEDTILTKLEWFHLGGRVSARQWNDILGIMRQQGVSPDVAYLRQWADALAVRDLLEQAFLDAGI
jgi:hypothetical protein